MSQVAERGGALPDFRILQRLAPAFDGVNKVLLLALERKMNLFRTDFFLEQGRVAGLEPVGMEFVGDVIYLDPALIALE
jgi:hypothetical protein